MVVVVNGEVTVSTVDAEGAGDEAVRALFVIRSRLKSLNKVS